MEYNSYMNFKLLNQYYYKIPFNRDIKLSYNNIFNLEREMKDTRPIPNPIPKFGIYVTMSIDELFEYVQMMSGNEREVAMNIMMLMSNVCHQVVEDEILSKDIFAI